MKWQLACFNRPWNKQDLDRALNGIAKAGFEYMGFLRHQRAGQLTNVLDNTSTKEDALELRKKALKAGLTPLVMISPVELDLTVTEAVKRLNERIEIFHTFGSRYVIFTGTNNLELRDKYCQILSLSCDFAATKDIILTVKPHGGISATADECRVLVDKVDAENFKIFYDPYNVVFYSNEKISAEEDIKKIVDSICGIIVKFPWGQWVDYAQLFDYLNQQQFRGACIVESLEGEAPEEVDKEAKKVYQYLENLTK